MAKTKKSPEEIRRRTLMMELVRELGITNAGELFTTMRDMFAGTPEDMLKVEMDEHLGYEKHDQNPKGTENRRNGATAKTFRSGQSGEIKLNVPRDREGSFELMAVKKGQRGHRGYLRLQGEARDGFQDGGSGDAALHTMAERAVGTAIRIRIHRRDERGRGADP